MKVQVRAKHGVATVPLRVLWGYRIEFFVLDGDIKHGPFMRFVFPEGLLLLPAQWEIFTGWLIFEIDAVDEGDSIHFLATERSMTVLGPNLAELDFLMLSPVAAVRVKYHQTRITQGRIHLPPNNVPAEMRLLNLRAQSATSRLPFYLKLHWKDERIEVEPPAGFVNWEFEGRPSWLQALFIDPSFLRAIRRRKGLMESLAWEFSAESLIQLVYNQMNLQRGISAQTYRERLSLRGPSLTVLTEVPYEQAVKLAPQAIKDADDVETMFIRRAQMLGFVSKLYWSWNIWNYDCQEAMLDNPLIYAAAKYLYRRMTLGGFYAFSSSELNRMAIEMLGGYKSKAIKGRPISLLESLEECYIVRRIVSDSAGAVTRRRKSKPDLWQFIQSGWSGDEHLPGSTEVEPLTDETDL